MADAAARSAKSLNQWMVDALADQASEDLSTTLRVG